MAFEILREPSGIDAQMEVKKTVCLQSEEYWLGYWRAIKIIGTFSYSTILQAFVT